MKMKITPDIYFIFLLFLSVVSHFLFPILIMINFPYNFLGILLIIAGCTMTIWVNWYLLKSKSATHPFDMPTSFLTSGLFKISRNPLYLGMTIVLLGIDIILGSLSPYIFTAFFIFFIDRMIIPIEEINLKKIFGSKYTNYKRKIRRWI